MQVSPVLSLSPSSPSFNSYSSSNLAEIAARVVQELRIESEISADSNIFDWDTTPLRQLHQEDNNHYNNKNQEEEEEEEEFEFPFVCREPDSSPISADEIFYNGQIKPIYPLFNTDLLLNQTQSNTTLKKSTRSPLSKLFSEDRETTTSCSSSEADELDGLQPDTYCVWTPKKADESSPGRCKKSNSTGSSSKRWKFRDLLHRSNSDGKETFVFMAASNKKGEEKGKEVVKGVEEHYVRNKAIKEGEKRRSFLPYRQDLMGFFGNVNGLSKNLHPF